MAEHASVVIMDLLLRLNERQQQLDDDLITLANAKAVCVEFSAAEDSMIRVNVGGQLFCTTLCTLRADSGSFLDDVFSGRQSASRDSSGAIFIDRDPKYFALILNWLRDFPDGLLPSFHLEQDHMQFVREAEYYRLDSLVARLNDLQVPRSVVVTCQTLGQLFDPAPLLW